jgi:hypothetical protein
VGPAAKVTSALAAVRAQHLENEAVDRDRLAALRQPPEPADDEAADRIEILVGEARVEMVVEVRDLGHRLHAVAPAAVEQDVVLGLVEVVLVLDVADDLLDHVLDRDEPCHAAILVHDDRDVVAVGAEFLQQHVEALGLRHEDHGAQHLAHVERIFRVEPQQVLGEEDADHVVAVVLEDGKPGVRLLDHPRDELPGALGHIDHVHLRARDHHVADLRLGDLQHALDHRERLGVEEPPLEGGMQQRDELLAVLGLAQQHRGKPLEEARLGRFVHREAAILSKSVDRDRRSPVARGCAAPAIPCARRPCRPRGRSP